MCTVLGLLDLHPEAVFNALMSVVLLQHELLSSVMKQANIKLANDRLNMLAIGYYNTAVEYEHLKKVRILR